MGGRSAPRSCHVDGLPQGFAEFCHWVAEGHHQQFGKSKAGKVCGRRKRERKEACSYPSLSSSLFYSIITAAKKEHFFFASRLRAMAH